MGRGLSAYRRYALRARVTTRAYLPMRLRRIRLAYLYYRAIGFRRYALMVARYALPRIRGRFFIPADVHIKLSAVIT